MKTALQNNIKKYMDMRNMSAVKLADAVGVERQSVYSWLNGQKMTIDKLFEIAEALDCSPETLLFGAKPIDVVILAQAITVSDKALGDRVIEADKKADLVAYVYEEIAEGHDLDSDKLRRLIALMR
jgi:transcriptional regulator with XRE-family HTH domain